MGGKILQRTVWDLIRAQHGVIARRQLLELGYSRHAISHRLGTGRLYTLWPGFYAVGRPDLTREGMWMGAVLACGDDAAASHGTAGALWGIRRERGTEIHVSVPERTSRQRDGIVVHRRARFETTTRRGIPITTPICTLIDMATTLDRDDLEAGINEADKRRLVNPERLGTALDNMPRRPGIGTLKATLDYRTFTLTDSQLERLFLPIAKRAGLPKPLTQQYVNGFRVDFYWPDLKLVVETDGLTCTRARGLTSWRRSPPA